jgi:hypothetical protein
MNPNEATLHANLMMVVRVIMAPSFIAEKFPRGFADAVYAWERESKIVPVQIFVNIHQLYVAGYRVEEAAHFIAWLKEHGIEEV